MRTNKKTFRLSTLFTLLVIAILIIVSCKKDDIKISVNSFFPEGFPIKASLALPYNSFNSATVIITVGSIGINDNVNMILCYSDSTRFPTTNNKIIDLGNIGPVKDTLIITTKIDNLKHNSTYYASLFCNYNNTDSAYTFPITIRIPFNEFVPEVSTAEAKKVSLSTAILSGAILKTGKMYDEVNEHGFVISKTPEPCLEDRKFSWGKSGVASFNYEVDNLEQGILYYYRAYAINDNGIEYGEEKKFYTAKPFKITIDAYNDNHAYSITQTIDGGYILVGRTDSYEQEGSILPSNGGTDCYVAKLHPNGKMRWQSFLGGSGTDVASSIVETKDGGYIIVGGSYGGIERIGVAKQEDEDAYIVKLDVDGNIVWEKLFGGSSHDYASSIKEISTGGFIVAGSTYSNDGDIPVTKGKNDYWAFKISEEGSLIWSKSYGGSEIDNGRDIIEDNDGGFLMVGSSNSQDGDITKPNGQYDSWLIKLNASGDKVWEKSYGTVNNYVANQIIKTEDGGSLFVGYSYLTSHPRTFDANFWSLKVDAEGNFQSRIYFPADKRNIANSVCSTIDGNYMIAGNTNSTVGLISENQKGRADVCIVKYNQSGIISQGRFGGSRDESASSIKPTFDGGYIVAGYSQSDDGDVSSSGGKNCWIIHFYEDELN